MAEPSRFKKKVHFGGTLPPPRHRPGLACGAFVLTRARGDRGPVALRGAAVFQARSIWSCASPQKAIVCMTALCLRWRGPGKTPSNPTGPARPGSAAVPVAFLYSEESL